MKHKILLSGLLTNHTLLIPLGHPEIRGNWRPPGAEYTMIDWERVRELRAEIGADDFMEVAEMFLEEADEAVARLTPGLTAPSIEADLHFLKGAALNLGFDALSGLCQDGERRAASGDTSVNLDAVRNTYFASKAAFEGGMDLFLAA
jgi:HPt (histidine-containing phosphotransfer) domain-containing protein